MHMAEVLTSRYAGYHFNSLSYQRIPRQRTGQTVLQISLYSADGHNPFLTDGSGS